MSTDFEALSQLTGKLDVPLVSARTALLVIDMQRYFVHPEYPLGQLTQQLAPEGTQAYFTRVRDVVIPNIQRLQAAFRAAGASIFYTEFGSTRADGRDFPIWARQLNHFSRQLIGQPIYPPLTDESCRVDESLAPQPEELIVQKTTSGPCNSTKLDHTLHVLHHDTVVVTGVATNICVAQTARELGDRDFRVLVAEDACAAVDMQAHEPALATIAQVFGSVASTNKVLDLLTQ